MLGRRAFVTLFLSLRARARTRLNERRHDERVVARVDRDRLAPVRDRVGGLPLLPRGLGLRGRWRIFCSPAAQHGEHDTTHRTGM
jgi:hypothetical protein